MKCKNSIFLTFGLFLLGAFSNGAFGQLAASTYQFSAVSGTYTAITGGTSVPILQNDDGLSDGLPIGFTFNFCGTNYTEIHASSNGMLSFNTSLTANQYGGYFSNSVSSVSSIQPALMPLWDDLSGASTGSITPEVEYITTGTAPNRVFTIQYKDWRWSLSASGAVISMQIKLYETSNIVEFIYQQEATSPYSPSATIGILDNEATPGYLSLDGSGTSPLASSTTFTTNIASRPATGQIYRFTPVPALDMETDSVFIASTSCSHDSSLISAVVTNLGTATIDTLQVHWSVDGEVQPPVTYTGPAIPNFFSANNTATVPLRKVFFADTTYKSIKAWTYNPNNLPDMVPENDTATTSVRPVFQGIISHITPGDTTICAGTSVILDAGQQPAGCIFIWSNGTVTQQTSVSQAGNYNVIVQSPHGCFAYDTVTITTLPVMIAGTFGAVDNGGRHFTFTPAGEQNVTSYFWDFGDGDTLRTSSNASQPHQYAQDGTYAVTLTESNTCDAVDIAKQVYVSTIPSGISGVNSVATEIKVYPNPARGNVSIMTKDLSMKRIVVYNVLGQKIYEAPADNPYKHELDLKNVASGMYNISVYTDKGMFSRKLNVIK